MWMIEFFAGLTLTQNAKTSRMLTPRMTLDVVEWPELNPFLVKVNESCGAVVKELHNKMIVANRDPAVRANPFTVEPFLFFDFGGRPLVFRAEDSLAFADVPVAISAGLDDGALLHLRRKFGALVDQLASEIHKAKGLQFMVPTIFADRYAAPVAVVDTPVAISVPLATKTAPRYLRPQVEIPDAPAVGPNDTDIVLAMFKDGLADIDEVLVGFPHGSDRATLAVRSLLLDGRITKEAYALKLVTPAT